MIVDHQDLHGGSSQELLLTGVYAYRSEIADGRTASRCVGAASDC
jgi:hypothetical protein